MVRFILVRCLQAIVALIGISILIFVMARASGDPALLMAGSTSTPEEIERIRAEMGLNKSLPEQYWIFVTDLAQGDLGESFTKQRPVTGMILELLPNTLSLSLLSFFLSMLLAVFLGVLGATRRDSFWDSGVKLIAVLGQALPVFWVGIMAILVFAVMLRWLPTSGMGSPAHFIMPVTVMTLFLLPGMMRLVRSGMLDVLDSEYIKLARIKGLPERTVIWKHALRNALMAPLTVAGLLLVLLITGTVVLENVFNWPGVGRLLLQGVMGRDFAVVQGIVLLVGAAVLFVNLFVDILYAYIDPRIRYQRM